MDEESTAKPRKLRPVKRKEQSKPLEQEALPLESADPATHIPRTQLRADPVFKLFLYCLVAGLATTTLALVDNDWARRAGLMGPLLATAAYPILGWIRGIATRPSARERFADNCYYLGFIFTQAALFLVFLPSTLLNRPLESRDILGFFGMALSAALVGLISRTILVQLGSSLPEAEDAIHEEVEEVARQVSKRSREIVVEFSAMATAAGTVTATINQSLDLLAGSLDRFDDVLRKELTSFELGAGTVDAALVETHAAIDAGKVSFGDQVENAGKALVDLQERLSKRANDALTSLNDMTLALNNGSNALGGFGELKPELDALNSKLASVDQLADDIQQQRVRLEQAVEASVTSVQESSSKWTSDGAEVVAQAAASSVQIWQQSAVDASSELHEKTQAFERSLADTSERLGTALKQFRDELAHLNAEREALSRAT